MTTHVLSNQEVIEALQSDAVEIHKQHVFMLNNKPDVITADWVKTNSDWSDIRLDYIEADIEYQYILGSIEHQINQLFI